MELGQTVMTRGINETIMKNRDFSLFITDCFKKYVQGDWGDTCEEDWKLNDHAVINDNDQIVALYKNEKHGDIFIITEWDKSVTTILFCNEY